MVFVLIVSVLFFEDPLTFLILVGGIGGREGIKMASAVHHQLMSQQDLILVHTVQLKPMIKYILQEEWSLVA